MNVAIRTRLLAGLLALILSSAATSADQKGAAAEASKPITSAMAARASAVQPSSSVQSTAGFAAPTARPAAGEQIKWQVISSGGSRSGSTNFRMSATVGQTAAGPASSFNYKVNQGFWQNFSGGSCCVNLTGNVDCDPLDGVDIGDLTTLIDNLFISFTPLCCEAEANCDGLGGIDIGDLTALIDNLFITFTPLAGCQ